MSRSRKKAIIKDKPKSFKRTSAYWRPIRSTIKNTIRSCKDLETLEIPNPKTIINDYDYCDYKFDYEHDYKLTEWWNFKKREELRKMCRRK